MVRTVGLFLALLLGTAGLAYGVGAATGGIGAHSSTHPDAHPVTTPVSKPVQPTPTPPASPRPRHRHHAEPPPKAHHTRPAMTAGARIIGPGDHGAAVRRLQARLRQIAWFSGSVTDDYGPVTTTAVRGFQAKRGIPVTGYVDRRTMARLVAMTHEPTADELANRVTPMGNVPGPLDARCRTGRVICIDKTSRTLRWVVDGTVLKTVDVRFGASYSPTREGLFHVGWKSRDHVSHLYGSSMPYAMFFSGGQAVHYSSDFAARGYAGASHGCVNVRDYDGVKWLFEHVRVGDKVVIYWS
jgi:lipoprotein-anchoring transpeptidase ErfK/SrfK